MRPSLKTWLACPIEPCRKALIDPAERYNQKFGEYRRHRLPPRVGQRLSAGIFYLISKPLKYSHYARRLPAWRGAELDADQGEFWNAD
jgi:hypothetical protein